MENRVTACWLTINRACNLRCKWCYARNADRAQMDLTSIKELLDFLVTTDIRNVIILGGEPTCADYLIELISACKKRALKSIVVTNGIKLADGDYLDTLVAAGVNSISLSQKAHDRKSYIEVTGVDCYNAFLQAVRNVSQTGIDSVASFVLTTENIPFLPQSIRMLRECGAKKFSLGFCYDFEVCRSAKGNPENPYRLWNTFSAYYEEIHAASEGKFVLQMGLPLCVDNQGLVDVLNERGQILTVCQLLRRSGLILDTDMSIIPCNAMFNYKLGKYGASFTDRRSFEQFWSSKVLTVFYNKLRAAPDKECLKCGLWSNCGGGCISNWFNYSFSELKGMKGD